MNAQSQIFEFPHNLPLNLQFDRNNFDEKKQ